MKFEKDIISSILEKNFSIIMPTFYEMQTEYLSSLNIIYDDLDSSLISIVFTNLLYKEKIKSNGSADNISYKNFYKKDNYILPSSKLKINKIASIINVPRETVRRKRDKLIKQKFLLLKKKKKLIELNTDIIDKRILNLQIEILTKFISKFSQSLVSDKFLSKSISSDQFKNDFNEKFLLYLTKFLDFQILYFSNWKRFLDIESIFIFMLLALNSTSHLKKENKIMNLKTILQNLPYIENSKGLNVSSISEITKIPRTTIIRKINKLEKNGYIVRNKYKRYFIGDLTKKNLKSTSGAKAIMPLIEYNQKLIINFFLECCQIFQSKN